MGLDMYAHSMPKDDNRPPVDFDVEGLHLDHTPRIHYADWMHTIVIADGPRAGACLPLATQLALNFCRLCC